MGWVGSSVVGWFIGSFGSIACWIRRQPRARMTDPERLDPEKQVNCSEQSDNVYGRTQYRDHYSATARNTKSGLRRWACSSVCLFVCLSVAKMQKLSNLELWSLLTTYRKSYMGFLYNSLLDSYWRHLENRQDVIFSAVVSPIWIKFGRLVQNDMPTAVIWSKSKPEVEFQYGGRLFLETRNSYISAADLVLTTKFGLLIETDIWNSDITRSETGSKIAPQRPPSLKSIWRHITAEDGPIRTKFGSLKQSDMPSTEIW